MLTKLVEDVVAVARAAGEAILAADRASSSKGDGSPVTAADLASHRVLVDGLARLEPLPVLSEEAKATPYETRRQWERSWLIDPLDGTKEFIQRSGEFTVNIALIEHGRPVLGVVHAPALKRSYWGCAGAGAFRQDGDATRAIAVATDVQGALEVVVSRSHASAETLAFVHRVAAARRINIASLGSALKLCLVAEGTANIYPRIGPTMEWDTAAAQAIVEAAGGRVTDLKGKPLRYNKPELENPFFVAAAPCVDWQRYA